MPSRSESPPPELLEPSGPASEPLRKPGWKRLLRFVLGIAVLAVCLYLAQDHLGELNRIRDAHLGASLGVLATYGIARLLSAEETRVALRLFGYRVGLGETFLLMIVVSYANLAIPRSGFGAPAVYFKRRYGVSYTDYGALFLPLTLMMLTVVGAMGLSAAFALSLLEGTAVDAPAAIAFGGVGAVALLAFLVRLPDVPTSWGRAGAFLQRMMSASARVSRDRGAMAYIFLLEILGVFVRAARLYLAVLAIGASADPLGLLVASLLGELAWLVSLTPSGLGVREAAVSYGASMMGITTELALSAAILDRLIFSLGVVVLAQFAIWRLARTREPGVGA